MSRLVHPQDTVQSLHRATGSHHSSQNLIHPRIGHPPLGTQTLTHDLLHHHQLRQADVLAARRLRHRLTQGPQPSQRVAQQRVLDGLGQLRMRPVEMRERPLIIQQATRLPPRRACQLFYRVVELRLRPLAVVRAPSGRNSPKRSRSAPLRPPPRPPHRTRAGFAPPPPRLWATPRHVCHAVCSAPLWHRFLAAVSKSRSALRHWQCRTRCSSSWV